jgi:hypothetical protein
MVDRRTATKLIRFHPDELRQITEADHPRLVRA